MLISTTFLLTVVILVFMVQGLYENKLNGIYERYNGGEFVFQATRPEVSPTAVLFLAHGCSHSCTDWWPRSIDCPNCIGLPVERNIVSEAVRRNYFVVAISSTDRDHKCWTNRDVKAVSKILNYVYETYLNDRYDIPLFLLGASSGGAFVGQVAHNNHLIAKIHSICVQISAIREAVRVPVLFVLMERDKYTLERVQSDKDKYQLSHNILISPPLPITESFFHKYTSSTNSTVDSKSIQNALVARGYLDKSLLLVNDPRSSKWRKVVSPFVPPEMDCLQADRSALSEALNLAWAAHEITDVRLVEIFDWFEAPLKL